MGDLPIQDVCYSPTTKKLMVRLADACDRCAAFQSEKNELSIYYLFFCLSFCSVNS